jgi:hypothetical protein
MFKDWRIIHQNYMSHILEQKDDGSGWKALLLVLDSKHFLGTQYKTTMFFNVLNMEED